MDVTKKCYQGPVYGFGILSVLCFYNNTGIIYPVDVKDSVPRLVTLRDKDPNTVCLDEDNFQDTKRPIFNEDSTIDIYKGVRSWYEQVEHHFYSHNLSRIKMPFMRSIPIPLIEYKLDRLKPAPLP